MRRSRRAICVFLVTMAVAACHRSKTQPVDIAGLPRGATILSGDAVPIVLHQCSRRTPPIGEATWVPSAKDIIALEAGLAAPVVQFRISSFEPQSWRAKWNRRYVGIVRGGKRYIYGDFSPVGEPVNVCDGGDGWFGIDYDVSAGRVDEIATNGIA